MPRVRIGECCGPIDAAIVRTAFDNKSVPLTIGPDTNAPLPARLYICVEPRDVVRACALLIEARRQDYWTSKELEAADYWPDDR